MSAIVFSPRNPLGKERSNVSVTSFSRWSGVTAPIGANT